MEPRRRNPLRRYPTAVCISVLHFGLTQSKTRALNSPARASQAAHADLGKPDLHNEGKEGPA
jgi:hypothetical protein